MSQEENINQAVQLVEDHVEKMYKLKFTGTINSTPEDLFKASAMAEIARRIKNKAIKIEEDWNHFTR